MKADEVRRNAHNGTLQIAHERVEASKRSTAGLFWGGVVFPIGR
jgi:hypothetical protein